MEKYKLGDITTVEISGVDKKMKDGEKEIRLCNFVDVYIIRKSKCSRISKRKVHFTKRKV